MLQSMMLQFLAGCAWATMHHCKDYRAIHALDLLVHLRQAGLVNDPWFHVPEDKRPAWKDPYLPMNRIFQ